MKEKCSMSTKKQHPIKAQLNFRKLTPDENEQSNRFLPAAILDGGPLNRLSSDIYAGNWFTQLAEVGTVELCWPSTETDAGYSRSV